MKQEVIANYIVVSITARLTILFCHHFYKILKKVFPDHSERNRFLFIERKMTSIQMNDICTDKVRSIKFSLDTVNDQQAEYRKHSRLFWSTASLREDREMEGGGSRGRRAGWEEWEVRDE